MQKGKDARSPAKRQVLFIQGGGERVHDAWDNKLVDSLTLELGSQYEVRYPRMPNEADPQYESWRVAIESELKALSDGAIVVGHSIGGAILIKVVAERSVKRQLGALILISAPFVGDGRWASDEMQSPKHLGQKLPKDVSIHIFHGLADDEVPPEHAGLYERAVQNAKVHLIAGRDHQFSNDLSEVAEAIRQLKHR